jgi:hypothetical protein
MSLDPKDLRLKLQRDIHAGLDALADVEGVGLADYAEAVLREHVLRRVHEATVITERVGRLGISGRAGDFQGKPGKGAR